MSFWIPSGTLKLPLLSGIWAEQVWLNGSPCPYSCSSETQFIGWKAVCLRRSSPEPGMCREANNKWPFPKPGAAAPLEQDLHLWAQEPPRAGIRTGSTGHVQISPSRTVLSATRINSHCQGSVQHCQKTSLPAKGVWAAQLQGTCLQQRCHKAQPWESGFVSPKFQVPRCWKSLMLEKGQLLYSSLFIIFSYPSAISCLKSYYCSTFSAEMDEVLFSPHAVTSCDSWE